MKFVIRYIALILLVLVTMMVIANLGLLFVHGVQP